jgi:transcriptional regulator with XRE-family HTH domain
VETLGDFVRRIRKEKNLTLAEVSDRSACFGQRITAGYICRIENNPRQRVTTDRLKALAHGLSVPAEDLFACALSKTPPAEPDAPYRIDLINAAMGAQRLSNIAVAKKAGVGVMTVSKIRNGNTQIGYVTLKKVVEGFGLTMAEVSTPKERST